MCIDHFMLIDDEDAVRTMRGLAAGSARDVPVVAGESGAAGVAGLEVLMRDPALARQVGLMVLRELDGCATKLRSNTDPETS
jgi:diaminopropionate ammonia-lyase